MTRAERRFEPTRTIHKGQSKIGNMIRCGKCKKTATHWPKPGLNPIVTKNHFLRLGWSVGKGPRADRCPGCLQSIGQPSAIAEKLTAAIQAKERADPVPETVLKPREMNFEDRQLIFAKLQDVYVDQKIGYENGWSDQKVADDLGVPRAWVSTMRDQNFGPLASNAQTLKDMQELAEVKETIKTLRSNYEAKLIKLGRQVQSIETRVKESLSL